jgi:hypothetical protein
MTKLLESLAVQSLVEYDGELIFSKELYAALVIKECIDVIDATHGTMKLLRPEPYQQIVDNIQSHFGVE